MKQLHAQILKQGLHRDTSVATKLISAFSLCRQMGFAVNVFNQVEERSLHLYNALIRAHVQNSQFVLAFAAFFEMQSNGIFADNFTYLFLLKACSGESWLPVVEMIHSHIEKSGFLADIFVPNSLIDSYSRCGGEGVKAAMRLFMTMEERDTVTWNSMIGGLVKAGELEEARQMFDEMPERDMISWNTMLDGYAKAADMNEAFKLFEKIPERNIVSWSTMVSGYSKAGDMEMARMLFDKMPTKNIVPWTIIISGYAEKGLAKEAICLYDQMAASGLKLDDAAAMSILSACAESGLLGLGLRVHASVEKTKFQFSTTVLNALIDMYVKCGSLDKAWSVFSGMPYRDLVSWNVMVQGLAVHGHGREALQLFSRMKKEGFEPDKVTFVGVLCACTHGGFVDKGIQYFYEMERDYGIVPQVEHYGCIVDLLGRGGRLKEAFRIVHTMPMEPNAIIWGALLGACRMHNATELAKEVVDHLVKLGPTSHGNYSMMSNIYASAGEWDGVANVRLHMKKSGIEKPSGGSSIEVNNVVHEFTALDRSHPKSDKIYQMVDRLVEDLQEVGHNHTPNLSINDFVDTLVKP